MKTPTFLSMLRDRDIHVSTDGDRLRCNAPAGALTPELRDELQRRKGDILEFLRSAGALASQQRAIVPLQSHGTRTPIFAVAGHNGDVFCYRALARRLGDDQPFFGLQPPGLDGYSQPLTRVEDLAAYFAAQVRAFHPTGPYIIVGFCAGGAIAFELATQLVENGSEISILALFGSAFPTWYRFLPQLQQRVRDQFERIVVHARAIARLKPAQWRSYVLERVRNLKAQQATNGTAVADPVLMQRARVGEMTVAALRNYVPRHFPGTLKLFLPSKEWLASGYIWLKWRSVAQSTEEYFGPDGCAGATMLREPYAPFFAELFTQHHAPPVSARDNTEKVIQPRSVPSAVLS